MDLIGIIKEYYREDSPIFRIYMKHSVSVRDKALEIAKKNSHLFPNMQLIEEASMLHDIGICFTNARSIECNGDLPYVCHGFKGFEILSEKGYKKHGLICERHTLMGITKDDIVSKDLPLPKRDMVPISLEEKIVCYADKFFSKSGDGREKTRDVIISALGKYGEDQVKRFIEIESLLGG